MAVNWPNIRTPSDVKERSKKAKISSPFEAGYSQERSKWTRGRMVFVLSWNYLPNADYQTLKQFLFDNVGAEINWTNPINGQSYTVRFGQDEIEADYLQVPGAWIISELTLEEK